MIHLLSYIPPKLIEFCLLLFFKIKWNQNRKLNVVLNCVYVCGGNNRLTSKHMEFDSYIDGTTMKTCTLIFQFISFFFPPSFPSPIEFLDFHLIFLLKRAPISSAQSHVMITHTHLINI